MTTKNVNRKIHSIETDDKHDQPIVGKAKGAIADQVRQLAQTKDQRESKKAGFLGRLVGLGSR